MRTFRIVLGLGLLFAAPASAQVNPMSFKMAIKHVALGTQADCSDLKTVLDIANPTYTDFTTDPTLGTFTVDPGTYPCVAFTINSVVKFTPASTMGACVQGQEVSLDLCMDGGCSELNVYLTTVTADGLSKSIPPGYPFQVPTPLVIGASASETSIFGVDARGKIGPFGGANMCGMQAPLFYFRYSMDNCSPACTGTDICQNNACIPLTGGCMPTCSAGQVCIYGTCVSQDNGGNMCGNSGQSCCMGKYCNSGLACSSGSCVPCSGSNCGGPPDGGFFCSDGGDCGPPDGGCSGGNCGPSDGDFFCPDGFMCGPPPDGGFFCPADAMCGPPPSFDGGAPNCGLHGQPCCQGQCEPGRQCIMNTCQ